MNIRLFNKIVFLVPIFLVMIISLFHVVEWFTLTNPNKWSVYLSVSIEVFALVSIIAITVVDNKWSVWLLYFIVFSIQFLGNVFYSYTKIDENSDYFKKWVELFNLFVYKLSTVEHKQILSLIQGGVLPLLSLLSLNYYISFLDKDKLNKKINSNDNNNELKNKDLNVNLNIEKNELDVLDNKVDNEYNKDDKLENDNNIKTDGFINDEVIGKKNEKSNLNLFRKYWMG